MADGRTNIRVGIAGWDYADWSGTVYPARGKARVDRLAYISRFVDAIEINSTFYRPVAPRVAESWVRRIADRADFRFTAKTHRSWTHEAQADLGRAVAQTLDGLAPLREAGRLGAILLQFPQSFHFRPEATERLERLLDLSAGWPAVAEVRHRSWESEAAGDWFRRHALGWCLVDQPRVGTSTARPLPRVTSPVGYARLHGRNAADWFRPDAGRDARYDYRYSLPELAELSGQVRQMAETAAEMFVIQNNHFRGQALAAALQMKHLVDGTRPAAPAELVAAYPDLQDQVIPERRGLF